MSLEDSIGLGFTVALTDHFMSSASGIAASMRGLAQEATGSSAIIDHALRSMETGMYSFGAGAAVFTGLVGLGNHAVNETLKVEGLRNAVTALAGDSGHLSEQLDKIAQERGVFQGEELHQSALALQEVVDNAGQLEQIMSASAKKASAMGQSLDATAGAFRNLSLAVENGIAAGTGVSVKVFKSLGLDAGDLIAQGIAVKKGRVTGTFDQILDGVTAAMDKKFGALAGQKSTGVKAMRVQIGEAIQDAFVEAGKAGVVAAQKSILGGVLDVVRAGGPEIGKAFGEGFGFVLDILAPLGRGLKAAALGLATFLKEHPNVVRIGVALLGIAAVVLLGVGAVMALGGAIQLLPFAMMVAKSAFTAGFAELAAFGPMVPILLGIVAVAYLIHRAWSENFGGIRDTLTHWYESVVMIVEGLWSLFTNSDSGVGAIPVVLQQQLMDRGLWPLVQTLFIWGERIKDVFTGAWDGVKAAFAVVEAILRPVIFVLNVVASGVAELVAVLFELTAPLTATGAGTESASNSMRGFGAAIGFAGAAFLLYKIGVAGFEALQRGIALAQGIWTFAVKAHTWATAEGTATMLINKAGMILSAALYPIVAAGIWLVEAAQCAWNFAMTANPLGLIIVAVVLLVAYVVTLAASYDKLAYAALTAYRWMLKASELTTGIHQDTSEIDSELEQRKADLVLRVKEGRDDDTTRIKELFGIGAGAQAKPAPGAPTAEDRAFAIPQVLRPYGVPTGAAGGGAPQKIELHNHLYLDDKEIHSSVVNREGEVQSLDGGAT